MQTLQRKPNKSNEVGDGSKKTSWFGGLDGDAPAWKVKPARTKKPRLDGEFQEVPPAPQLRTLQSIFPDSFLTMEQLMNRTGEKRI